MLCRIGVFLEDENGRSSAPNTVTVYFFAFLPMIKGTNRVFRLLLLQEDSPSQKSLNRAVTSPHPRLISNSLREKIRFPLREKAKNNSKNTTENGKQKKAPYFRRQKITLLLSQAQQIHSTSSARCHSERRAKPAVEPRSGDSKNRNLGQTPLRMTRRHFAQNDAERFLFLFRFKNSASLR